MEEGDVKNPLVGIDEQDAVMSRFDTVYAALPVWAQHAAVSAYGTYWYWLRFGAGYQSQAREFASRANWKAEQWREWQQARLRQLLDMAARQVPYYRDHWTRHQKQAAQEGNLEALPLLEKASLRADPKDFLRQDMKPVPHLVFHTSGSTGTPIATHWTARELRASMAIREVRSANWAGVSFRQPRATFSGRLVEPNPESKGPFYRFNWVERQAYLSAFHLRPATAPQYVEALRRHRIQWLTGYAVSYSILARYILEQKLSAPPLKAIITTSEKLTAPMRALMEEAFRCPVFEEYSTVENVLFSSQCPAGRLHVSPDIGVVEILRPDGSHCASDEVGEVVATCLFREYQPLIRYRLGDLAKWDPEPCPCGCAMPVIKEVIGRVEDVVVGTDGREMVRFHGLFVDQPHVQEGQVVQESLHTLHINVVGTKEFGPADAQDLKKRVRSRLGPEVEVVVNQVGFIPRSKSGKLQAVISKVPRPPAGAARP